MNKDKNAFIRAVLSEKLGFEQKQMIDKAIQDSHGIQDSQGKPEWKIRFWTEANDW